MADSPAHDASTTPAPETRADASPPVRTPDAPHDSNPLKPYKKPSIARHGNLRMMTQIE